MAISNTAEARVVGKFKDDISGPASKAFKKIKSAAKVIGVAAIGAATAITALTVKFVKAANEQEAAEKKLEASLKARGQFSEEIFAKLKQSASELQSLTTVGDETIIAVQAQLVAFSDGSEDIGRLSKAVLDLSAGMGTDLKASALLLGKAMAGEFGTLSRYGIFVKEDASKTEKLDMALKQIEGRFGGQAAAKVETFGGKFQQLKNIFGDLQEELGFLITKNSEFTPVVKEGIDTVIGWIQSLRENKKEMQEVVSVIGGIVIGTFKLLITVLKGTALLLKDVADAWNAVSEGAQRAVDSVANNIERLKQIGAEAVQKFVDGFKARWDALKDRIGNLIPGWLKKFLQQNSPAELGDLDSFSWGSQAVDLFSKGMNNSVPGLETASGRVGKTMSRNIGGAILSLKDGFKGLESFAISTLDNIFNSQLRGFANSAGSFISKGLGALGSFIFGSSQGNVFSNGNLIPFAQGGIISQPSFFPLGGGIGTIAENQPEAILPLGRTSSGDLGVKTVGSPKAGGGITNIYKIAIDARGSNGEAAIQSAIIDALKVALPATVQKSVEMVVDGRQRDTDFFGVSGDAA